MISFKIIGLQSEHRMGHSLWSSRVRSFQVRLWQRDVDRHYWWESRGRLTLMEPLNRESLKFPSSILKRVFISFDHLIVAYCVKLHYHHFTSIPVFHVMYHPIHPDPHVIHISSCIIHAFTCVPPLHPNCIMNEPRDPSPSEWIP